MGLTDDHLAVLRVAIDTGGLTVGLIGAPFLEGMVSMQVLTRGGINKTDGLQYYLVTRAGKAAYERRLLS